MLVITSLVKLCIGGRGEGVSEPDTTSGDLLAENSKPIMPDIDGGGSTPSAWWWCLDTHRPKASVVVEEQYSIYTVGSEMYRAHNA